MQQAGMGHLIRQARQAKGWTQDELGRRIGYTKTRVSRAETGAQPIRDVTVLRRLADVLGVSPSMFGLANQSPTLAFNPDIGTAEGLVDRRAFLGVAGAVGVSAAFPRPAAAAAPAPAALLEKRLSPRTPWRNSWSPGYSRWQPTAPSTAHTRPTILWCWRRPGECCPQRHAESVTTSKPNGSASARSKTSHSSTRMIRPRGGTRWNCGAWPDTQQPSEVTGTAS